MKIAALMEGYLESLVLRNVSPLTYRDYSHYLNRFLDYVGDLEINDLTPQTIADYKKYLSDYVDPLTGLTLKRITQNYLLIALRSLIEFVNNKKLTKLTKKSIELIEVRREKINVADKTQFDQLLNLPDVHTKAGLRDKAILETLLSSGLLVSELSALNREDIDIVNKKINLDKTNKSNRVIYLFERCSYWLEKYLNNRFDTSRPLFIRYQGREDSYLGGERMRLTPRSIERIVEKYARTLGLRGKITPQSFRNFLAFGLIKEGVSQVTVQDVLGHTSKFSTDQYIKHLNNEKG